MLPMIRFKDALVMRFRAELNIALPSKSISEFEEVTMAGVDSRVSCAELA
jgi:hypothetical protein